MGEEGHARHGIRRKIQKVEAIGVHDVVEEVRERGAEPAREEINEEGVPIWAVLGKISRDDARGRMPCRLPPPQGQEEVLEVDRIDCRREVGELRPPHRRLALRRLLIPGILGRSLAPAGFGRHGSWKGAKDQEQWRRRQQAEARTSNLSPEEEERNGGSEIGRGAEGK